MYQADQFLPIETINQIQSSSKILKDRFKSTENKVWDPSNIASELVFQSTHLMNSVICELRPEQAQYIGPLPGANKGIGDESSDVFFNLMNLANSLNLNAASTLDLVSQEEQEKLIECKDPLISCSNLTIQSGELWDSIFRKFGYKHMTKDTSENDEYIKKALGGTLLSLFATSKNLKIDLNEEFLKMHKDANNFIDKRQEI